jgi:DNA-binding NarL/FixJ family response regulator
MQAERRPALRASVFEDTPADQVRRLLVRLDALQGLLRPGKDGGEQPGATELAALRLGLRELEQMADELLISLEPELQLSAVPDASLSEALTRLVENTAEELTRSSRLAFAGHARPLTDYRSRLLYSAAQAALADVSTHEGGRRLRLSLEYQDHEIIMSIEDDGLAPASAADPVTESAAAAFPEFLTPESANQEPSSAPNRYALDRLQALIEQAGGRLTSSSNIEQGTQVHVHLPYEYIPLAVQTPVALTPEGESGAPLEKVRLLIVDARAVSRAGLRRLLESYADLEVVGEASESVQALSETAELLPRVVLIDAHLPETQSLEIVRQVRQLSPTIHTLLLASEENEELLYAALRAGAGGYILQDIDPDELAQAVRGVARGDILIQPQLAARLLTRGGEQEKRGSARGQESLTMREREVLQLLARGLRNKEIAARLFVSERTVTFHLANIYSKLQVSGRTEALSKALEQGLLKS